MCSTCPSRCRGSPGNSAGAALQEERIVNLAGPRLEAAGNVADLNDFDQAFRETFTQVDRQVSLGALQMVEVETHFDIGVVYLRDHRETINRAVERPSWLAGLDAQRLDRNRHIAGSRDVAGPLETIDDACALLVPRHIILDLSDEADEIGRAEILRDRHTLADLGEQLVGGAGA